MDRDRIRNRKAFLYGALLFSITACGDQQDMMPGNGRLGMADWNWLLIVVSLGIGVLLGDLLARRRKQ